MIYIYWSGWIGCMGVDGLVLMFGDDYDVCDFKKLMVMIDYEIKLGYLVDYYIVDMKLDKVVLLLMFDYLEMVGNVVNGWYWVVSVGYLDEVK